MDINKAYQEITDALSEVMTISPAGDGYMLAIKRTFHDGDGKPISGLFFMLNDLTIFTLAGNPKITLTEEGAFSAANFQGRRIGNAQGGFITLDDFINLAMVDPETVPYIDMERAKRAAEEISRFYEDSQAAKKKSPRSAAIEKGALMTIGGHIATYSTDDLKDALNAYSIWRLPTNVDKEMAFDKKTGQLNALVLQNKTLETLESIHTAVLMFVLQAVSLAQSSDDGNTVTFYLPKILRELGIDPRSYSSKRRTDDTNPAELRFRVMAEILAPFDPLVGRTPDGSYYRLLTFESYDRDSETMTLNTPYLYKLKEITAEKNLAHPPLNRLLHSDAANEPNRAAVELASRILTGIATRGTRADYKTYTATPQVSKKTVTTTDGNGKRTTTTTTYKEAEQEEQRPKTKTVTWRVKFSTLIDDCPQLKYELAEIERKGKLSDDAPEKIKHPAQAYNAKLKQTFEAAYRIITEKSDAPEKYADFKLPMTQRTVKGKKQMCYDVPTKSTVTRNLVITHKGKNAGN